MADITELMPFLLAFGMVLVFFIAVLVIATYVYMGLTLSATAKKLRTKQPWLAWIPVGNIVLMSRMAKMHWWPALLICSVVLLIIPYLGIVLFYIAMIVLGVFSYIWTWKICEARHKPGYWSILQLIPFVGGIWTFIMWGSLAWSK
jgi:hypothetical protein